jgi:hypothetical protein
MFRRIVVSSIKVKRLAQPKPASDTVEPKYLLPQKASFSFQANDITAWQTKEEDRKGIKNPKERT